MTTKYEWKTVRDDGCGGFDVHGFKVAESGLLKGQTAKFYLESYHTVEDAVQAHPELMQDGEVRYGNKWTDPQVNLRHLPDENTPVAGGMYPDDYDDND